jgi:hypothetical protein
MASAVAAALTTPFVSAPPRVRALPRRSRNLSKDERACRKVNRVDMPEEVKTRLRALLVGQIRRTS